MDLYLAAGKDLRKAERGIIFMDEFDKLLLPAVSERGVNVHDDVQSQLLTMLEGSDVELKTDGQSLVINTSRILFVLAGAFQGIDEFIRKDRMKRENSSAGMGFLSTLKQDVNTEFIRENINHDVLMEYGMKTELAGRISSIAVLEKLGREELLRILTEADDGMPQCYAKEVELGSRAKLIFREDALEAIADEALESGVGARALRSILSRVMLPVLYKAPAMKGLTRVVISRECVTDGVDAEYVLGEDDTPLSELIRESREDER
jgi:ATP-dependent Clp protease ATP-binding subunit ClpX